MAANTMSPKIAIIGAGPAGLTLARLLSVSAQPLSFTVFEQDPSASARTTKGGTLDLHDETGIAALQAAGLSKQFYEHARYEGEAMVIADKHAQPVFEMRGSEGEMREMVGARPEIDREVLRDMLLESVPRDSIKWGCRLDFVTPDGLLQFEHGTEGSFDLIVGADGAWSHVRPVLTKIRPTFSGISGFEMRISKPDQAFPDVSQMVGRGSYFACSDGQSLQAQRLANNDIMIYAWGLNPENYPKDLIAECNGDGEKIKERLKEIFRSWDSRFHGWIGAADPAHIRPWPLYELPVGHTWEHRQGFTLIGDSAHVMTPFAGEGVNAAMKDALDLAEKIGKGMKDGSLEDAVARYEVEAFSRNSAVQEDTMNNKELIFRDDAPHGFMESMQQAMDGAPDEAKERLQQMVGLTESRGSSA